MSEHDQRAMYSLRESIEGLRSCLSSQWEQQQRIQMALDQIVYELARLNEQLENKKVTSDASDNLQRAG